MCLTISASGSTPMVGSSDVGSGIEECIVIPNGHELLMRMSICGEGIAFEAAALIDAREP